MSTCPPQPGIIAWLICAFGMLMAHPYQVAALAALLLACLSAAVLARRRADHAPVAWALGAGLVADIIGTLIAPAFSGAGPYTGWTRLLFHVDEARFLVWPAALVWVSRRTFGIGRPWLAVAFWASWTLGGVVAYSWLRGDALRFYYALAQGIAVLAASAAGWLCWMRRDREPVVTPARIVTVLLVAMAALSLLLGPWSHGLYGAAYIAEQWILTILYIAVVAVQAWFSVTHRLERSGA